MTAAGTIVDLRFGTCSLWAAETTRLAFASRWLQSLERKRDMEEFRGRSPDVATVERVGRNSRERLPATGDGLDTVALILGYPASREEPAAGVDRAVELGVWRGPAVFWP